MSNLSIFNEEQRTLLLRKTPKKFIKQREGRGGKILDYVEVGYVTTVLNELTGYNWSFQVLEDKVIGDDIIVKGKLTLHSTKGDIVKENYGGAKIVREKGTEKPIDIGDNFKAAVSDCLKKCASMFGVASDVYWKADESIEQKAQEQPRKNGSGSGSGNGRRRCHIIFKKLCEKHGIMNDKEIWKKLLQKKYSVDSSLLLNDKQIKELLQFLLDLQAKEINPLEEIL